MYVIKCVNKDTSYYNYADYCGDGVEDIKKCEIFDDFEFAEKIKKKYIKEDKMNNITNVDYIIDEYNLIKEINNENENNLKSSESLKNIVNIESQLNDKKQKVFSKEK